MSSEMNAMSDFMDQYSQVWPIVEEHEKTLPHLIHVQNSDTGKKAIYIHNDEGPKRNAKLVTIFFIISM